MDERVTQLDSFYNKDNKIQSCVSGPSLSSFPVPLSDAWGSLYVVPKSVIGTLYMLVGDVYSCILPCCGCDNISRRRGGCLPHHPFLHTLDLRISMVRESPYAPPGLGFEDAIRPTLGDILFLSPSPCLYALYLFWGASRIEDLDDGVSRGPV